MTRSLGKLTAYPLMDWHDQAKQSIQEDVAAFLELGEAIATRWIQTQKGVMLLQMVPGVIASGSIYVLDRIRQVWYMLSFEACDSDFTKEKFDRAYCEYKLFHYVDQPGLLLDRIPVGHA
ncbi:MAG: hypothetical protein J0G35_18705 [Acidobacteriales bacterium]|nr:hypothetical protein [Terriglobales bacterium]